MSDLPSSPASSVNRAMTWNLRSERIEFGRIPRLMGIVNVTPDSFSDGGEFFEPQKAVDHALSLVEAGADILDIGGESTRPYADSISANQELDRIGPVVDILAQATKCPLSIDTSKATVARHAIAAGAEIINDITGLEGDPDMISLAAESGAGVCAMHMQGTPQSMQENPQYQDVVMEIHDYLRRRRDRLLEAGIELEKICLDPGIGFGKTHQHNYKIMSNCDVFQSLGCPILVGHSRKGFLAKILGDKQCDRTYATVGASLSLAVQGVQVLRVHDIQPVREALLAFEATGGIIDDSTG